MPFGSYRITFEIIFIWLFKFFFSLKMIYSLNDTYNCIEYSD